MKSTHAILALLLSASAAPVLGQAGYTPPAARSGAEAKMAEDQMPRPSKGASKQIVELQRVIQAKDAAAYPAALAAAKAAAKTNEDRYLVARLQLSKAFADKDEAGMAEAINDVAATGLLAPDKVASLLIGSGASQYGAKQYDQAAASFERALTLDPTNTEAMVNLAETRFAQGRKADAVPLLQKAIAADIAAGRKPEEAIYRRTFGIAYEARLPSAIEAARQWIAAYPNATSWRNALAAYQNLNRPAAEETLNLLRLMRATSGLDSAIDVSLYASAAVDQGNFSEAQAVLDEALANKSINPNDRLIKEVVDVLKTKPKATAADLETATREAKTAAAFLRIGDRYYGMGNYAKAIELYRMAEAKGGADQNLLNMHLGMALARNGDKAGAAAAFKKVSGPSAPVAQFWTMYVSQPA